MAMTKQEFCAPSSDGIHTLRGVVYLPEGEARGYFHVVHGMTEYIGRYDAFMTDMARAGWICFGYDNLGHGKTVNDNSELGYIAKKDGFDLLCRDVKVFSDAVMSEYKETYGELPYILMCPCSTPSARGLPDCCRYWLLRSRRSRPGFPGR